MSRFDKVIDKQNAEAAAAKKQAEDEKREQERRIERRKQQYLPIIAKYWQEFQSVLPRLSYEYDSTVLTKFLMVDLKRKVKVRPFLSLSAMSEYCFDMKGNCYRRNNFHNSFFQYIRTVDPDSVPEVIFNMLPWSSYDGWRKNKTFRYKSNDDLSAREQKAIEAVLTEMIDGNADEAVAKFFESQL